MNSKRNPSNLSSQARHYKYLCLLIFTLAASISYASDIKDSLSSDTKSIVIMCENDVHCNMDGYIGFAGLRDAIASPDTSTVFTVSAGDFLQGNSYGALGRGKYAIEMMNAVGYDVVALGNHEFDYGVSHMKKLLRKLHAKVSCANLTKYARIQDTVYPRYIIKKAGGHKVAFIGVLTTETLYTESAAFKDRNGRYVYDLNSAHLYQIVQQAVDDAHKEGADFIIALTHIGEEPGYFPDTKNTIQLISNTRGIDIVLDAHSHHKLLKKVANADGKEVLMFNTGTKFEYYGKVWISNKGDIAAEAIPSKDIRYASKKTQQVLQKIKQQTSSIMDEKICTTSFPLFATEGGKGDIWKVRNQETNLGDLVCDAIAQSCNTRIALCNGGGVRSDIQTGTVTYASLMHVCPFFNDLCVIEATGIEIMNALEEGARMCPLNAGAFLQCAGMKYTIDTRRPCQLGISEDSALNGTADRRVTNVQVQQADGSFIPISPSATYQVATTSYVAHSGDEIKAFHPCHVLRKGSTTDTEALKAYCKDISKNGIIPEVYHHPQGRITVLK